MKKILLSGLISGALALTSQSFAAEDFTSLWKPVARGALSDDSIYFVMTDRFENGNSANDEAGIGDGRLGSGYDPTDIGYYHGGDFVGLTQRLEYIKGLGFTSIWITPPVVNRPMQGDSASYHGYWGTDFTTIDPHLGTEAEFKAFVSRAHSLGMKVIVDIVVNHTADVISPKIGIYSYRDTYDYPYRDSQGKIFDASKVAGLKSFPKLDLKKSFPYEPFVSNYYKNIKKPHSAESQAHLEISLVWMICLPKGQK
jgi:glycosidase